MCWVLGVGCWVYQYCGIAVLRYLGIAVLGSVLFLAVSLERS